MQVGVAKPMQQLLLDIWPAEVVLPDGRMEKRGRVFITDVEVHVIGQRDGDKPVLVYSAEHTAPPDLLYPGAPRTRPYTAHTAAGPLVARRAGCACGSALGWVTLDVALSGQIEAE